jgi:DNA-binding NarL/FixJ family response regulator
MKKKFVSLHRNLDVDVEWGFIDGEFYSKEIPRKPVHLTPNDRRLIKFIAMGLSRGEICEVMGITRKTYRQYLWRLKKKAKAL